MWSLPSSASHTVNVDPVDAWDFACKITGTDCSQITPPKVEGFPNGEGPCQGLTWGAYSYQLYPDTVFLCVDTLYYADPVFVQSVVAHEMTHYLDVQKDPEMDSCLTEWNAHRVGNAYVYSHGHPEWADFDWQVWYGCWQAPANDQDNFTIILGDPDAAH
jgi:hypothetical protein